MGNAHSKKQLQFYKKCISELPFYKEHQAPGGDWKSWWIGATWGLPFPKVTRKRVLFRNYRNPLVDMDIQKTIGGMFPIYPYFLSTGW